MERVLIPLRERIEATRRAKERAEIERASDVDGALLVHRDMERDLTDRTDQTGGRSDH